ncbi:MAG: hypothetical protein M3Y21_04910 [Candidatus Eremiobacteraeota bacterium]|nr:hypothetical protein [Candidatus Eremiobacteraeota bacterium]
MVAAQRIQNVRTAKAATQRRQTHSARMRYAGLAKFSIALIGVAALMMIYVMLVSNLTSLNYSVAKADHERSVLQAQTARLDDQLGKLRSDDRLAAIAAQLGMRDPAQFAIVTLPTVRYDGKGHGRLALLSTVAGWLNPAR